MEKKGTPSFLEATLVLMVIVLGIAIGVVGLKVSPNITILAAIGMVMLYAVIKKYPTDWLHEGIINGIKPGIIPIFIFILVGSLIAVWIQAGIIPTLMVIGFKLITRTKSSPCCWSHCFRCRFWRQDVSIIRINKFSSSYC